MYIDLKSAFDSVDHEILFKKMKELGISNELRNTIEWIYQQTYFRVSNKNIPIKKGLIQGGVLSPTLFIIMFNDLMTELKRNKYISFAYADDLAVVGFLKCRLL